MHDEARETTSERMIEIADEFLQRLAAGEAPEIDEYAERYPELAEEIRLHLRCYLAMNQDSQSELGETNRDNDASDVLPIEQNQLPVGIGRYQLRRLLGQGNMGAVYLAYDLELERTVALKIPRLENARPKEIERFYREARSMATVDHPNVCAVFDVAELQADDTDQTLHRLVGRPYLTMAYIEGAVFSTMMDGKPWPSREAARLTLKISRALQAIHEAGIVHRDFKPGNIILDRHQEPIVTDFGLARRDSPNEPELTVHGQVLGSPAYMSPEQVSGKELGPSTDIYSLGVVLYELLCGRRPFAGSKLEVLRDVSWVQPPRPRDLRHDVDPALEAICWKAISKSPEDRYASASEMATALAAYLDDPSGGSGNASSQRGRLLRHPAVLTVAGIAIILSVVFAWFAWQSRDTQSVAATTSPGSPSTTRSYPVLPANELRGRFDAILQERFKHRSFISKLPNAAKSYREVFASYGIGPRETIARGFGELLSAQPADSRAEILLGLEGWRSCTTREQETVPVNWLDALLAAHHPEYAYLRASISKREDRVRQLTTAHNIVADDIRYAVIWSFYLEQAHKRVATDLLTAVHRAHPNQLLLETALGIHLRKNRSFQKAIEPLETALGIEESAVLWTNLGICHLQNKNLDKAITALRKSIQLDPDYGIAYHFLGRTLYAQGDYGAADAALRTAIEKDTSSPAETHRYQAYVFGKLNRAADAQAARMKAIPFLQSAGRWALLRTFAAESMNYLAAAKPENLEERFKLAVVAERASKQARQVRKPRRAIQRLLEDYESQTPIDADKVKRLQKMLQAPNRQPNRKR